MQSSLLVLATAPLLLAPAALAQPHYTARVLCERATIYPYGLTPDGVIFGVIGESPLLGFTFGRDGLRTISGQAASSTFVYGANAQGTIVGELDTDGIAACLLADPTQGVTSFSPLGGTIGIAYGAFPDGTVIGSASLPNQDHAFRPFTWRDGIGTELPLPTAADGGGAFGFSVAGYIVGAADYAQHRTPMRWYQGIGEALPSPAIDGFVTARYVNNHGEAVGAVWTDDNNCYPLLWTNNGVTVLPHPTSSEGTYCEPAAINDLGQVVGNEYLGSHEAVIWINGQVFNLRELIDSDVGQAIFRPFGIDNAGRVLVHTRPAPANIDSIIMLTPIGECGTPDFDFDGQSGTDADIAAFFACLAGDCCLMCQSTDFNADGDPGTDADIEGFFRVLAGQPC